MLFVLIFLHPYVESKRALAAEKKETALRHRVVIQASKENVELEKKLKAEEEKKR